MLKIWIVGTPLTYKHLSTFTYPKIFISSATIIEIEEIFLGVELRKIRRGKSEVKGW